MSRSQQSKKTTNMSLTTTIQNVSPNLEKIIEESSLNVLCHGGEFNGRVVKAKEKLEKVKKVQIGESRYKLEMCGFHPQDTGIHFLVAHQHEDIKSLMSELIWLVGGLAWAEGFTCPEA